MPINKCNLCKSVVTFPGISADFAPCDACRGQGRHKGGDVAPAQTAGKPKTGGPGLISECQLLCVSENINSKSHTYNTKSVVILF